MSVEESSAQSEKLCIRVNTVRQLEQTTPYADRSKPHTSGGRAERCWRGGFICIDDMAQEGTQLSRDGLLLLLGVLPIGGDSGKVALTASHDRSHLDLRARGGEEGVTPRPCAWVPVPVPVPAPVRVRVRATARVSRSARGENRVEVDDPKVRVYFGRRLRIVCCNTTSEPRAEGGTRESRQLWGADQAEQLEQSEGVQYCV